METYTLSEAAERSGVSVEAMRRRADRGTLRTVKREGVRRVPRSELERAGLRVGDPAHVSDVVRELTETIRRQERELVSLRALPERVESTRRDHEREAEARAAAEIRAQAAEEKARHDEAAAAEAKAAAEAAQEWREHVARAGWRQRRRLLREARTQAA